jgi:flagellar biosynthesis protein FlhG
MMEAYVSEATQEVRNSCPRNFRVIAVTSGKGGVGKTNIVTNLGMALARDGRKVLILDADLGLANVEVMMGITPSKDLRHILHEDGKIEDVITKGLGGVDLLSGNNGSSELTLLDANQKWKLLEALEPLANDYDTLLIDTGAGIGSNVRFFAGAAQEVVVVVGPEPTSLTDAYSIIKVLAKQCGMRRVLVCVNRTTSLEASREVFAQLYKVSERFLSIIVEFVGWVPQDMHVQKAVMAQSPFIETYPMSPASQAINKLGENLLRRQPQEGASSGFQMFWRDLLSAEEYAP